MAYKLIWPPATRDLHDIVIAVQIVDRGFAYVRRIQGCAADAEHLMEQLLEMPSRPDLNCRKNCSRASSCSACAAPETAQTGVFATLKT